MDTSLAKNTFVTSLLLLLSIGTPFATAQTVDDAILLSTRAPAVGARMLGIGTAGYGGFGDYTAMYGNPAGLALVQRSSFTGTIHGLQANDEASSGTHGFDATGFTNAAAAQSTSVGNLALVYKAPTTQGSLVMGLAYNQVASFERALRFSGTNNVSTITTSFLPFAGEYFLSEDSDLEELDDLVFSAFNGGFIEFFPEFLDEDPEAYPFLEAVIPGSSIDQHGRVTETGRISEANLGSSLEVSQGTFVGASLNIVFGRYEFRSRFEEDDVRNENTAVDYNVLQDDGSLLEGFDFLTYEQRLGSDVVGVNLRVGVSQLVGQRLRVGLSIETPTRLSIDESYSAEYETLFDDGGILRYGDQAGDVGNGTFSYRLRTPWRMGAGVTLDGSHFKILADLQLVEWRNMHFSAGSEGYFDDLNDYISENFGVAINAGAGMEAAFGKVLARGGVAYQADPSTVDLDFSDGSSLSRDQLHYSAGLGYKISPQTQLNIGWSMTSFDGAYLPYPEDGYGPRQKAVLQIDENVTRHQVVVGLTHSF